MLVHEGTAGLDRDSVVNVSQIVTVDRSELQERLGVLPQQLLAQLDNGLRLALDV
ncbi:MAG TPA: type II toxin-antitoxin system PemK/MazF family toxin [Chloroflexota bacterium]|nr:type II toxin-antitoxin system PemK/MazF family toxin [Chloroflexota bacterium]